MQRSFGEPQLIDEASECRTQVDFRFHFQSKFECALNFVSLHGNQLIAGLHLQSACVEDGAHCTFRVNNFEWHQFQLRIRTTYIYILVLGAHDKCIRLDTVLARAKRA